MIDYVFRDPRILLQSLTHSSYSNENSYNDSVHPPLADNERLEFLGDAVIGLVVAQALMERYPEACEGRLSRWRSQLVSRRTLAEMAMQLGLGDFLLLGRGELRTGGSEKRSILAGAFEAVVGAVFVDGGMEDARRFLVKVFEPWILDLAIDSEDHRQRILDKKTHLQERTQSVYRTTPIYRLVEAWGLEHEKHFRVEIVIDGKIIANGDGRSKKEAEQAAAGSALELLGF